MKKNLVTILVSILIPAQTFASNCTILTSNMGLGSRGTQISLLQTYLVDAGLLSSSISGYFGNLTFAALKMYQGIKQISQTGFVGSLTRGAIQKDTCTNVAPTPPSQTICTMEARLCPDGSSMERNTSTCAWQPNSCKSVVATTTATIPGSNWDPKQATTLSESALNSLKAALQSVGFNVTTFATTSMSEAEIMEMTRKFERDYIIGK